jgi:hypothetical protein
MKRKRLYPQEVKEYLASLPNPVLRDFYDDYTMFVDKENIYNYEEIPFLNVFKDKEHLSLWLAHHHKTYNNFREFLKSIV